MDFDMMGKPGDTRNFIHKTIFAVAKGVVRAGVNVVAAPFVAPIQALAAAGRGFQQGGVAPAPFLRPQFAQGRGVVSRTTTQIGPAGVFGKRTTTRFQARAQAERFQGVRANVQVQGAPTDGGGCGGGRGTHVNRSGYFVQSQPGNPFAGGIWIEKGTVCVPNRSRNAGNGRAVVRATSRIASFDRLARRVRKQMKAACR